MEEPDKIAGMTMTMTTTATSDPDGYYLKLGRVPPPSVKFHLQGTGNVTIDWGDGSHSETVKLIKVTGLAADEFTHHYFSLPNTITITGENVTGLRCDHNELTALDVSKNSALEVLYCCDNKLTELDVSKNTALTKLRCIGNQLTALDVTKNTALTHLDCTENQLTADALNALFETLHGNYDADWVNWIKNTIYIGKNPGVSICDKKIARRKKWKVEFRYKYDWS